MRRSLHARGSRCHTEARNKLSVLVPLADVIDVGLKATGVWISSSTIGGMIGIFAAVAQRKSLRTMELWGFLGGAMGTAFGFLLMLCAIVALTR